MQTHKKIIKICLLVAMILTTSFFMIGNFKGPNATAEDLRLDDQEATIRAIKKVIPAVVSIIVYDQNEIQLVNIMTGEITKKSEKVQRGSGTGILITTDGMIITNKHVVNSAADNTAEYRVILNSGKQYFAQLIGKDPVNDLAVLKIFDKNLPTAELGNSDALQLGTSVVAIGNTLGRYQNSATKGIVSGLGRSLVASDSTGNPEALDNVIQTDANINLGNSGGPLIDLSGKVVGINVAIDQGGEAIGFAIPVNDVKQVVKSVKETGMIKRARLGIRYIMVTPEIAQDRSLRVNYGALITPDDQNNPAIIEGSPAQKAGIGLNDIILEINGVKLTGKNTLLSMIQRFKPGDKIGLKIQRGDKVIIRTVVLDEFK